MNNDNRRLRVSVSLFSATLLITSNIFIFATFSIYSGNPAEFEVGFLDMLASLRVSFLLLFFAFVLPGLFFSYAFVSRYVPFALVLGVLFWVQANFLLWDYGVFDGRDTSWDQYHVFGWLDITLWVILLAVSIRFASRILPFVNIIAWILLVGQATLLFNQGGQEEGFWKKDSVPRNVLPEKILELSEHRNIFHFILDSFQTDVFIQIVEESNLYSEFSGFTLFYENAAVTPHTSFAIPAVFSEELFDGTQSPAAYYKSAIANGFQNALYQAGYTVNLIPKLSMRDGSYSNYYKIPSTYNGTFEDLKNQNAAQLMDVALFRSAPHLLRKFLYDDGNWLLLPIVRGEIAVPSFQEKAFLKDYIEGIKIGNDTPAYHFIHIMPPHPPYVTLEDGSYAGEVLPNTRENFVNQSRSVIVLIRQFIAKLKSLGIYNDALIVLQGDHGSVINPVIDGKEIKPCLPRLPALLAIKSPGNKGTLKVSDTPTTLLDIAPTILQMVGGDGVSVFELDTTTPRQRPYLIFHGKSEPAQISRYLIEGSVFDPHSCKKQDQFVVFAGTRQYEYGTEIQFGMTGNADPFMGVGWSTCHSRHCWTNGNRSTVHIPVKTVGKDLMLHARFRAFVDKIKVPQQRIRVSVNDTQLTEWIVTEKKNQDAMVRIPAKLVIGEEIDIAFDFPDATSPKSIGLGGDPRMLGVAMMSLRLDVLDSTDSSEN